MIWTIVKGAGLAVVVGKVGLVPIGSTPAPSLCASTLAPSTDVSTDSTLSFPVDLISPDLESSPSRTGGLAI